MKTIIIIMDSRIFNNHSFVSDANSTISNFFGYPTEQSQSLQFFLFFSIKNLYSTRFYYLHYSLPSLARSCEAQISIKKYIFSITIFRGVQRKLSKRMDQYRKILFNLPEIYQFHFCKFLRIIIILSRQS